VTSVPDGQTGVELATVTVAGPPSTLFHSDDPHEIVTHAAQTAHALAEVIKKQKLDVSIQGRRYVKVEGWTLLGTMLGVFPVCTWTHQLENGWEARVEARTLAGAVVGSAEAMCLRSERSWMSRDDYALRSMAQTRATSKALRQPLGFVMAMGGYEATPFEEMPPVEAEVVEVRAPSQGIPSPAASPSAGGNDEPMASQPQIKNIFRLLSKLEQEGIATRDRLLEAVGEQYGAEPNHLTKAQASELITRLKARAGESNGQ
jgi:hypothetical protein